MNANDDDLVGLMPEAPPPRPSKCEAAICEALRRFDQTGEAPAQPRRPAPRRAPWWEAAWTRPGLSASLAAAMVALIALPMWYMGGPPADHPATRSVTTLDIGEEPQAAAAPPDGAKLQSHDARPAAARPAARPAPQPQTANIAPPPAGSENVVATAQRPASNAVSLPAPAIQSAPAPIMADAAPAAEVVTVAPAAPAEPEASQSRGDWNACTVADPARDRRLCPPAKADDDRLTQGVDRAWRGQFDSAIATFDQVIADSPRTASAYLNRGLTYDRKGDSARALADLDRAIQLAPRSARAYHHRAQVLERQGETARAAADRRRAIALDPRYRAVDR